MTGGRGSRAPTPLSPSAQIDRPTCTQTAALEAPRRHKARRISLRPTRFHRSDGHHPRSGVLAGPIGGEVPRGAQPITLGTKDVFSFPNSLVFSPVSSGRNRVAGTTWGIDPLPLISRKSKRISPKSGDLGESLDDSWPIGQRRNVSCSWRPPFLRSAVRPTWWREAISLELYKVNRRIQ